MGRIKRYRTLIVEHLRKGKEKLDEDILCGNADHDEESEYSEPPDHIKREGSSVERAESRHSQITSDNSESEESVTDEFERPWPKDTLPSVLKAALKRKFPTKSDGRTDGRFGTLDADGVENTCSPLTISGFAQITGTFSRIRCCLSCGTTHTRTKKMTLMRYWVISG
jgi:hypothetical protein